MGKEVRRVFKMLEGKVLDPQCKHLLVSPFTTRSGLLDLIDREIQNALCEAVLYDLSQEKRFRSNQDLLHDLFNQAVVEALEPTYRFDMADGSLFGWMVGAPKDNFIYECRWTWR